MNSIKFWEIKNSFYIINYFQAQNQQLRDSKLIWLTTKIIQSPECYLYKKDNLQ